MTIKEMFPDKVLAEVVAYKLNIEPSKSVTKEHLLLITNISHWVKMEEKESRKICNLEGIQHLKNLTHLFLQHNNIVELKPLSSLVKLEALYLDDNNITEIEPLANLPQLKTLALGNNPINDILPISDLTYLETLRLSDTKVKDFSPITNLVNLQELSLLNTNVKDLSYLSNLKHLQNLLLPNDCNLTTFPMMKNLTSLYIGELNESRSSRNSVKISSNAKKLKYFLDYDSTIKDYSFIANLPNLKHLSYKKKETHQ